MTLTIIAALRRWGGVTRPLPLWLINQVGFFVDRMVSWEYCTCVDTNVLQSLHTSSIWSFNSRSQAIRNVIYINIFQYYVKGCIIVYC